MDPLTLLTESSICLENKSISEAVKNSEFCSVFDSGECQNLRGLVGSDSDDGALTAFSLASQLWDPSRIRSALAKRPRQVDFLQRYLLWGLSALYAFLQANVTGPPFKLSSSRVPNGHFDTSSEDKSDDAVQTIPASPTSSSLGLDGTAIYPLAAHLHLFAFAKAVLGEDALLDLGLSALWARLRINFWHQKLLAEQSPLLREKIYQDLRLLKEDLSQPSKSDPEIWTWYLLERAAINLYYGYDSMAKEDLKLATRSQHFEFALTGRPGRRTKFQQQDLSQLVVLAKSAKAGPDAGNGQANGQASILGMKNPNAMEPKNLSLDDDTILESISFAKEDERERLESRDQLSASLAALDPGKQPLLNPLDSIILLTTASAITNTSPEDGLTREETLPYATRVIEGGSSNWQVYTQALLVRCRIEGHKTRTAERSVLQLQALVDQVIAETQDGERSTVDESTDAGASSTFLPRSQKSESANAAERLRYVHQISPPFRWSLEAELAAKWMSIGGLRTAVEIYERLEMWAEAALCWAVTGKEDKARDIIRRQLRLPETERGTTSSSIDSEMEALVLQKDRLPTDAPRLLCILGDLETAPSCYSAAWNVSNERYARAQRSLGKFYTSAGSLKEADEAYAISLRVEPQISSAWFSLGCVRLARQEWESSIDAFTRTVKIDPEDAEAWSNLGAALARTARARPSVSLQESSDEDIESRAAKQTPRKQTREALVAFKRAASLKRDSYQIWQNILNMAATITPPPYADALTAQKRLIELRGTIEGESCIDVEIMEGVLSHIISSAALPSGTNPGDCPSAAEPNGTLKSYGLENVVRDLVMKDIKPLITHSRRLWQLVARLALHLNLSTTALDAYEKAWRCTTSLPNWDDGFSAQPSPASPARGVKIDNPWSQVVDATIELVDAYESLGERGSTEGPSAGSGQLVCKNWKFKARMAVKSVLGRREKAGLGGAMSLEQRLEDPRRA